MEEHECVKEWMEHRPFGTKSRYVRKLMHFCQHTRNSPEEFLSLDRLEARDLVWKYIKPFINDTPSKAKNNMDALKSFYRSKDGESLPFDSRRGGKHHFNARRRKRAAKEHVPDKAEMYRIIDATTKIRDKTMFLILFQSGIRVGALCNLKFRDVRDQLYRPQGLKIPLRIRITDEIDTKLRGYSIPFYDTWIQGEAVEALKAYCDRYHKDGDLNAPLFYTRVGPMKPLRVWETLKSCVSRAALDPGTIWVHTIRRAFKRVVRRSHIEDEDFKEAIMGHVLPGSRENYFSREIPEDIEENYVKIDFSREVPGSMVQKQASQIEELQKQLKERDDEFYKIREHLNELTRMYVNRPFMEQEAINRLVEKAAKRLEEQEPT